MATLFCVFMLNQTLSNHKWWVSGVLLADFFGFRLTLLTFWIRMSPRLCEVISSKIPCLIDSITIYFLWKCEQFYQFFILRWRSNIRLSDFIFRNWRGRSERRYCCTCNRQQSKWRTFTFYSQNTRHKEECDQHRSCKLPNSLSI